MSNAAPSTAAKPPWHFWVVGIVGVLWNSVGAMDYVMTQTRNEAYMKAFTPEKLAYFYGIPSWVVAAWAIGVWGGVVGMLLLLLRKRAAVPVLLASLVGATLTFVYDYLLSEGMEVMGASGAAFAGLIIVIALGLYWYARLLRRRGVLR